MEPNVGLIIAEKRQNVKNMFPLLSKEGYREVLNMSGSL